MLIPCLFEGGFTGKRTISRRVYTTLLYTAHGILSSWKKFSSWKNKMYAFSYLIHYSLRTLELTIKSMAGEGGGYLFNKCRYLYTWINLKLIWINIAKTVTSQILWQWFIKLITWPNEKKGMYAKTCWEIRWILQISIEHISYLYID